MIPELGHFALILALVLSLVQAVVPLVGARRNSMALMAVGRPAAQGQFFFILFSYVCLTWAFITSDFSVQLAASNSVWRSRSRIIGRTRQNTTASV